ncbi:MAG: succinate dehydrogenase [Thermoproteus sp.]|nr:succinate dehydrogenase [Thermoproteus sp.]
MARARQKGGYTAAGRGVGEWFRALNYERILFAIHRITGIYLVLYIFPRPYLVLLYASWTKMLEFDLTPVGKILTALFIFSLIFHGLNGLRIMLIELGVIRGWPVRHPIASLPALRASRSHKLYLAFMIIAGVLMFAYSVYLIILGLEYWP